MPKQARKTLSSAVESGQRIEVLYALQKKLVDALDASNSGRDIAALSRQLRDVSEEIERIENEPKREKITALDEVLSRHGIRRGNGHTEPNEDD